MRGMLFGSMVFWAGAIVAACGGGDSSGALFAEDGGGAGDAANGSGCPKSRPASASACAPSGLTCTYGCNVTATCNAGAWSVRETAIACAADAGRQADGAVTCASDNDCANAPGLANECAPGGRTLGCGICAVPKYPCNTDAECTTIDAGAPPKPMVCGSAGPCMCPSPGKAGGCIPACQNAGDCDPDQICASGHCIAKPCTSDAECPSTTSLDYACVSRTCAPKACTTDADCGGHHCVNRLCYPDPGICVQPAA